MDEKVSSVLGVAVCATKLDCVELGCSLKSAIRSKSRKKILNFVKKFVVTGIGVSLLYVIRLLPILGIKTPKKNTGNQHCLAMLIRQQNNRKLC